VIRRPEPAALLHPQAPLLPLVVRGISLVFAAVDVVTWLGIVPTRAL
jgi:hypothetical protein